MLEMVMLTMFNASSVYTSLSDFYAKNPRLFQINRQGRWILDIYLYTSIPLSTFLTTMARLHANKLLLDDPSSKKRSRKAPKKDFPPVCFLWCPEGDDRRNNIIHTSLPDLCGHFERTGCIQNELWSGLGCLPRLQRRTPSPKISYFSSVQSEHPRTTGRQT